MKNADQPAFPADLFQKNNGSSGLTKREHIAAMICAGLCARSSPLGFRNSKERALSAAWQADCLLRALDDAEALKSEILAEHNHFESRMAALKKGTE